MQVMMQQPYGAPSSTGIPAIADNEADGCPR